MAVVDFASGAVLANDGKGTNILASMGKGAYTLIPQRVIPTPLPEEIPATAGAPLAPIVSSLTHPDPEKWYSDNNPEFSWKLPLDVTDVSLTLNKVATADPGSISDGLMSAKGFEDIDDGIWYLHVKFKNKYGWGQIAHRKALIDKTAPESFDIEVQRENASDPQPILLFKTV
ncbi:MAG: hypothetical protein AAB956_01965, partial [Patescibacteria group bacterium]